MNKTTELILIGGSAGSLQALFRILEGLEPRFAVPVLLVLHRANDPESTLEELLTLKTFLSVKEIEDKDLIRKNTLYVCPPDYHVLTEPDKTFSLDDSEKVNYSRPSLDVVFRSAADVFESSLAAILLSGANADGAEGLEYIHEKGGITIVQDPLEAQVSFMPEQALKQFVPDKVLTTRKISDYLNSLI